MSSENNLRVFFRPSSNPLLGEIDFPSGETIRFAINLSGENWNSVLVQGEQTELKTREAGSMDLAVSALTVGCQRRDSLVHIFGGGCPETFADNRTYL